MPAHLDGRTHIGLVLNGAILMSLILAPAPKNSEEVLTHSQHSDSRYIQRPEPTQHEKRTIESWIMNNYLAVGPGIPLV